MKKYFVVFATMAIFMTSCNLVEDIFDWSDKEFSSDIWTSAQRNVVTVELSHWGSATVTLPETGVIAILPDYEKGRASLLFKSYQLVDPTEKPEGSDYPSYPYWVRKALYMYLCVNDVPFKVSDDGKIQFSKKTVSGTLTYGDMSGDTVDLSNKQKDCKVSISGGMAQDGAKGSFLFRIPMKGDLCIKIITPDGEHLLIGYTELDSFSTDEGFLSIFR